MNCQTGWMGVAWLFVLTQVADAQPPRFDFLAIQDQPGPTGGGNLFGVGGAQLNNAGDAAFLGK